MAIVSMSYAEMNPKTAEQITYDNSTSGLEADNVQDAIDDIVNIFGESTNRSSELTILDPIFRPITWVTVGKLSFLTVAYDYGEAGHTFVVPSDNYAVAEFPEDVDFYMAPRYSCNPFSGNKSATTWQDAFTDMLISKVNNRWRVMFRSAGAKTVPGQSCSWGIMMQILK